MYLTVLRQLFLSHPIANVVVKVLSVVFVTPDDCLGFHDVHLSL